MTSKTELRREIARKRRELDPQWRLNASMKVVQQIESLALFQTATSIALYKAIGGEVDLNSLFPACWGRNKLTCIPVFNAAHNQYEMAKVSANTQYKTGNYGIEEPRNSSMVPTDKIDLIIVPGVAFDYTGNRLGRGGGYYDRLLDDFNGSTVAATFDFQLFPAIPADLHDIPVEYLVSETKIIKV